MSAPDPLEQEHVIGWTGRFPGTLLCHPTQDAAFISALGSAVCVGDVHDPHKQRFLRGHDATVSALAVSSTGRLVASGQLKSTQVATGDAAVMVWDLGRASGGAVYTFFGLTEAVLHLAFSPDERFLAAGAADNTLSVWDMTTGEQVRAGGLAAAAPRPGQRALAQARPHPPTHTPCCAAQHTRTRTRPSQVYTKRLGSIGGGATGSTARCIHFLAWGPVTLAPSTKRPAYTLAYTVFERVHLAHLEFDFRVMRYAAATTAAQLPATGFSRAYTSGALDPSGRMLLGGTAAGELAVYSVLAGGAPPGAASATAPTPLFKTALAAAGNGVHALCVCPKLASAGGGGGGSGSAAVFLGGGDGVVRCFVGRDFDWLCTAEARLPARVVSLSLSASATWLLVGTATGSQYRVAWGGAGAGAVVALGAGACAAPGGRALAPYADLIETSHTGGVHALGFHPRLSDAMVTASADGSLRLWNLNDYRVTWAMHGGAGAPSPQCLWVTAAGGEGGSGAGGAGGSSGSAPPGAPPGLPCELYVGFSDGTLRAFRVRGSGEESSSAAGGGRCPSELWRANAHRGGVSAVCGNKAVIVTGGGDARVNVWSRANHDLLLAFNDHSRPIVGVRVDPRHPEVVYSAAGDGSVVTYNLRAERRIRAHTLPASEAHACTITALAQLTHASSEHELLAGTSDGRIYVFDPDVAGAHAGAVDVLALLGAAGARAARSSSGGGGGGGGGGADAAAAAAAAAASFALPASKPGQARPELRLTALAVSPSSRYLAVGTACGRLLVLSIPSLIAGSGVLPSGGGGGGGAGASAVPHRGPVNAGTFMDLSGALRPALVSQAAVMVLLSCFRGGACYSDVRWAPDERQVVGVGSDATVQVFNFFPEE